MINSNLNITYLTCIIYFSKQTNSCIHSKKDLASCLANIPKKERPIYIQYINHLLDGEDCIDLSKIKETRYGKLLTNSCLVNPTLLVNKEGELLKIGELQLLQSEKSENEHTVLLPKNQFFIEKLFIEDTIIEYIKSFLNAIRVFS